MKGFTLIETIIYIAVFGLLLTTIILATEQLLDAAARNDRDARIMIEALFVLEKTKQLLIAGADPAEELKSDTFPVTSLVLNRVPAKPDDPEHFTATVTIEDFIFNPTFYLTP